MYIYLFTYGLRVHTCICIYSYDYVSDPTEHRSRIYVYRCIYNEYRKCIYCYSYVCCMCMYMPAYMLKDASRLPTSAYRTYIYIYAYNVYKDVRPCICVYDYNACIYIYIYAYILSTFEVSGIPPNFGISNNICDSICIYITYISIYKMYIWGGCVYSPVGIHTRVYV